MKASALLSHQDRGNILILFSRADAAISKPDLLTRIEQGEDPNAEDQEDSEGGETPTDPSTGEPRDSWDSGGRWRQMWARLFSFVSSLLRYRGTLLSHLSPT